MPERIERIVFRLRGMVAVTNRVGLLALGSGLLVRLTVKDHLPYASTIFYALPVAVLSLIALFLFIVAATRRQGFKSAVFFFMTLGCAICWYSSSWPNLGAMPDPDDIRAMTWNVAGGQLGQQEILQTVTEINPHILAIVEGGFDSERVARDWKRAFPEHNYSQMHCGLMLLCRGEISNVRFGELHARVTYLTAHVRLHQGEEFNVIVVDINASPFLDRCPPIKRIASLAKALSTDPVLILGDFNTPPDSVHFDLMRGFLSSAAEVAGTGYNATWPMPFPVLPIDQIWTSKSVEVRQCVAKWTVHSDHRPLVAYIRRESVPNRELDSNLAWRSFGQVIKFKTDGPRVPFLAGCLSQPSVQLRSP